MLPGHIVLCMPELFDAVATYIILIVLYTYMVVDNRDMFFNYEKVRFSSVKIYFASYYEKSLRGHVDHILLQKFLNFGNMSFDAANHS